MLLLMLKTSIATLILAIGMTVVTDDIVYLWRRPVLLVKSITAMYVVVPAVAVLMAFMLDLPRRTELALVILAICAGAPLLPKKLIKFGGDPSYVFCDRLFNETHRPGPAHHGQRSRTARA